MGLQEIKTLGSAFKSSSKQLDGLGLSLHEAASSAYPNLKSLSPL